MRDKNLARLAALEAVAKAASALVCRDSWWTENMGWGEPLTCIACDAWEPDGGDPWRHAPDCPAIALGVALDALRDAEGGHDA